MDHSGSFVGDLINPGQFELVELVGSGGEAQVYRAERVGTKTSETVAVKVFDPAAKGEVAKLHTNALHAGALAYLPRDEPHLVRYIGSFDGFRPHRLDERVDPITSGNYHYLVTSWEPGEPYSNYITFAQGDMRPIATAAKGLAALHQSRSQPLVHGDVKPANIVVQNGVGCMVDLGNVRRIGTMGPEVGSPRFMSPRFLQEEAHPRHDAYSLALVALTVLDPRIDQAKAEKVLEDLRGRDVPELVVDRLQAAIRHEIPEGIPIDEWFAPLGEVADATRSKAPTSGGAEPSADPSGEKADPGGDADGGHPPHDPESEPDQGDVPSPPDDGATRPWSPDATETATEAALTARAALTADDPLMYRLAVVLCDDLVFTWAIVVTVIVGIFIGVILDGYL